ncbi:MAG: acyltransferase family protein [Bacteroidaceae bacterium]|nr:acyltransferase family protein [Bacteroidaceae bacterium]
MDRKNYLDNLKVCLTILVIFHHAGQAYGDGGEWAYTPSNPAETMPWIWHFFAVNASFFMGLFFLISGYFVPTSFDKQGTRKFIGRKLTRLGIPLLIIGGLLTPLTGKFEVAHMWFVESLLVFSLIYALVRNVTKHQLNETPSKPSIAGLLIAGLLMGIGTQTIRSVSPQDHWILPFSIIPLPMEPAHYLQYTMMFVMGILARRFSWLEQMGKRTGAASLLLGILLAGGIYIRNGGWWNDFVTEWFGIYESLLCIFISFGLLWFFREKVNGTGRFAQWCAEQSYGAYILHLLLMLGLQFSTDDLWFGAFGKFFFIGAATTVASYLLTWLLRLIPGAKRVI